MRRFHWTIVIAGVLACVATAGNAGAVEIQYVVQGIGSGQANTTPFTDQPFTLTLLAHTENVVTGPFYLAVNNDSVALQVGVTNYTGFAGSSYVFPQPSLPEYAGFTFVQALVGTDWDSGNMNAYNLAFTTYDMKTEIGPLSIPNSPPAPTSLSLILFTGGINSVWIQTMSQVTFQATFVPEPTALILGTIAGVLLASGRRRRKSVPHNRV